MPFSFDNLLELHQLNNIANNFNKICFRLQSHEVGGVIFRPVRTVEHIFHLKIVRNDNKMVFTLKTTMLQRPPGTQQSYQLVCNVRCLTLLFY